MSESFRRYTASHRRLLDVLEVLDKSVQQARALLDEQNEVSEQWSQHAENHDVHLRLIHPRRDMPYLFVLAHMEKDTVRETSIPENVVAQCLAGKMLVTDAEGRRELIVAPFQYLFKAHENYRVEAMEEVYNIMKVINPRHEKDPG